MTTTVPYVDAFMCAALCEARRALDEGEVAVGCVLVHKRDNARAHDDEQQQQLASSSCQGDATLPPLLRYMAARGRNATNAQHHALAHAEFMAVEALLLQQQQQQRSDSTDATLCTSNDDAAETPLLCDLSSYVLYVTCEPCIMCAAFLLYNRIGHVFYGCRNDRFGGNGSILALHDVRHNRFAVQPRCTTHSNNSNDNSSSDNDDGCGVGLWGYASEGGHRAAEAVALLQTFYRRENPHAPGHKRRRKPA